MQHQQTTDPPAVQVEDTSKRTAPVHILDSVASAPGELWFYDHSKLKTPFSRWLAINRQRRDARFRHTRKDISRVVFSIDRVAENPGIIGLDDGSKLTYYMVSNINGAGHVISLHPNQVPSLADGCCFLWTRPHEAE